jgi:acyl-coenzyme A thioesterase PaaI-like protein
MGQEAEVGEGEGLGSFTADLRVRYLRPVRTPGAIAVVVKRARKEGRKEWWVAELKQWHGVGEGEDEEGEVVVCATGEALFVTPRAAGGSRL